MTKNLRTIFIIQSVLAFLIVVALNYYAMNLSITWSILCGLGFIFIVGTWASYRLKKYRQKQNKQDENKD